MFLQTNDYEAHNPTLPAGQPAGRQDFLDAVHAYCDQAPFGPRARLIESLIRASRNVGDDDGIMESRVREAILGIRDRYCLFSPGQQGVDITTFRQAREMLRELFF